MSNIKEEIFYELKKSTYVSVYSVVKSIADNTNTSIEDVTTPYRTL